MVETKSAYSGKSSVWWWLSDRGDFSAQCQDSLKLLSREFDLKEYELGDCIIDQFSNQSGSTKKPEEYIYLVCEGRIRLLSFDSTKNREVSTNLLSEGDVFGGYTLWHKSPLAYTAKAADKTKIARVEVEKFKLYLDRLPELARRWQSVLQKQQQLIFFKTMTELRCLPSQRIQQLLPYLLEKSLAAGNKVEGNGQNFRFWLISGQVLHQSLQPGDSWGYPDIIDNWESQTDLLYYELPQTNWQIFSELAPELIAHWQENLEPNSTNILLAKNYPTQVSALSNLNQSNLAIAQKITTESAENPQPDVSEPKIAYPKPKKCLGLWQAYPFVQQQSSSDCGAACLATICRYWGKTISINYLREAIDVGRSGASLKKIAVAAENLGFQARPVRASLNRMMEQKNPWIAHWNGDHYVVIYRVKKNLFLVADPAVGKFELSRAEFLNSWTGFALLLEPTADLANAPTQKRSLSRYFSLLLPYRSIGLTIIIASILIQLLGLVSPLFTQIILDRVVVNRSQSTLNALVMGILLFGVLGIGLGSVRSYLLSYLANRLDLTMISGFINHALNLPLKFFESRRVGDIVTRVQENQKIQQFLIEKVLLSWLDFFTGFIYLGLMLYYNWRLTVLILLLIPPIVILTLAATPLLRKISRARFNATADQNSALVEMMSGISTVKAVTAEKDLRWRWEELLTRQLNVQFKGQKLAINLGFLSNTINTVGGVVLLWYGATLVIQGELSIGQFVAFNMMKGYIITPVLVLIGLWDELQEVLISVERLNDVFDTKAEVSFQADKLILPQLRGDIELDNVTFRYDSDAETNILQNISVKIEAGQTVAIVGRSGSGKSTLVKLIQGLYQPTHGNIAVDGHNLKHVDLGSLRGQIGVVPQDCFLFSGTILENITLYRPEFSLEQVIATAKLAEAHAFIQALPLGYSTKVGERGDNLSGGQRQRIAIARAFLGKPPILILDEATSSLDTESERRFQENLTRLSRQRTTLIIAHRLSTVRNADCIIVLDRGSIVERGTHDELFAQKGLYYELARQQLSL